MRVSKPKVATWFIAVVLGVIGILAHLVPIPGLSAYAFWFVAAGFVLLALGTSMRGL